jgi:hypothetical protein
MKKNLLLFCLALMSSIIVSAQTTVWTNANATGLWSDAANWTEGLPAEGGKVVLNIEGAGDCVLDIEATINQFVLGDNGGGDDVLRIVEGGKLTTGQTWSGIGWGTNAKLIVEKGGELTFGSHMWAGWNGDAEVFIYGTVNVTQMYGSAFEGQPGSGYTSVRDFGVLNLANIHPDKSLPEGSFLDVTNGGRIVLKGNHMTKVVAYAALGRITANDGEAEPVIAFEVTGEGETADTLTVITIERNTTSVSDMASAMESFDIYPNPSNSDILYIKNAKNAKVEIFNLTGQMVLTRFNASYVDIRELNTGVYIVRIEADGRMQTRKLIRE